MKTREIMIQRIDARWSAHQDAPTWRRIPLGVTERGLAALAEMPFDKRFRQELWAAREAFRARTKRQIVIDAGELVVLSADEQAEYARKHQRKARIKARRALNVAASVPLEQLPEAQREAHARKVEKMAHLVALDEIVSRKRDVLAGLGDGLADQIRGRAEEARSRTTAWERLFR